MATLTHDDHVVDLELIKLANSRNKFSHLLRQAAYPQNPFTKSAFIPGGDPSMTGGGAPPGGDPSGGMGGMPGMPGMDPSGGGGAPPMDPSMGGGGAPPPPPPSGGDPALAAKMDQILQAVQGGGAGGAQSGGNMAGQIKPKIDVNVAIMQLSKMVARIADALGVKIPASEMIATPDDLTNMAQKQQAGGQQDAAMGGGGGIQPIPPMPDMSAGMGGKAGSDRFSRGEAFSHVGLEETGNKAAAIMRLRQMRQAS